MQPPFAAQRGTIRTLIAINATLVAALFVVLLSGFGRRTNIEPVLSVGSRRDSLRAEMNAARNRVAGTQRVFVGSQDRTASVELRDPSGRVRARPAVDSAGTAQLQFLDVQGHVTASYPGR